MYVGVHTPLDVGVSLGIGLILMFVLYPFFRDMDDKPKRIYILFAVFIVLAGAFVAFVELYSFPADLDTGNYASGLKNAYMILFCAIGLLLVFHLDRKYINFPTEAVWWAQIIKVAVGLGVTVGIKAQGSAAGALRRTQCCPRRTVFYRHTLCRSNLAADF